MALVTRDSDTTFKVKGSRSPGWFTQRDPPTLTRKAAAAVGVRTCWAWETIDCNVAVCFGPHRGMRGAGTYRGGRPPTACYIWLNAKTRLYCIQIAARNYTCDLHTLSNTVWRSMHSFLHIM